MTEEQRAKMNEAWEKYKEAYPPKGSANFYYSDNTEYWHDGYRIGYTTGLAEKDELLAEAVKALEFYADVSSWYINGSPQYLNHIIDDDLQEADEPQPLSSQKGTYIGGKLARTTLEKIRKGGG